MAMIAQELAVLAIVVLPILFAGLAYGQYGGENSGTTPEQLRMCTDLGIPLNKCTEQNILAEQGIQKQLARTEEGQPSFDFVLMGIVGGVIGVSVVYIMLRTRKETKQTSQM